MLRRRSCASSWKRRARRRERRLPSRRSPTGILAPPHDAKLMRTITADDIDRVLTYPALVEALRQAFRSDIKVPVRHHHPIGKAMLLLMPSWTTGEQGGEPFLGCKIVTVFPDN